MIVLIGGLPGSGKTFFARRLAWRLQGQWLSSDRIRRSRKATGKYRMDDKLHIYQTLADLTEQNLLNGESLLVIDATFSHRSMRDVFLTLGERIHNPVLLIWIYANEDLVRSRLRQTREDSEADYDVFEKIRKQFEPITFPFLKLESTNENIEHMLDEAEHYIAMNERR